MRHRSSSSACLLLLIAPALIGCVQKNEYQAPPPPEVTVDYPVVKTITRTLEFTGSTSPSETVEIRARVKGFLTKVNFTEGAEVKKGDVLFEIDPKPFLATKRQAEAALKLAEAQVKSSEADFNKSKAEARNADAQLARGERAAQGGAVTASEVDDLRTARDAAYATAAASQAAIASAVAQVEAAKAQIEQADLDLGYTQVKSPIDGRVGEALVDIGNLVGASEPTHLTTIVLYDPIDAYYTISESDLLMWIRWKNEGKDYTGPSEQVNEELAEQLPLKLGLANEKGFPHSGVFDYADLAISQSSGTFQVRGRFENKNRDIPPGAFVRIQVPLEPEPAMLIDERAIGRDQGGAYALVVVEKEGKQVVERRDVEVEESHEHLRIITGGLTTEDRVVVNGVQRARPGGEVRAIERSEEEAADSRTATRSEPPEGQPEPEQPTE